MTGRWKARYSHRFDAHLEPWDNSANNSIDGNEYVLVASSESGCSESRIANWAENHPGALN
jgi:hypothetical protein